MDLHCYTVGRMKTQHDKTTTSTNDSASEMKSEKKPEKKQKSADAKPADAAAAASSSPVPQKIWDDLHDNLTQALGRWEHLSEEADRKVSPEEAQLQEVKRLLDELKNKLREFSR